MNWMGYMLRGNRPARKQILSLGPAGDGWAWSIEIKSIAEISRRYPVR